MMKHTTCAIVGGGPAGAMLALLLARRGVEVTLLEAHHDFAREFRGDTLHPPVMELMEDLGLADRLLSIRHTRVSHLTFQTSRGAFTPIDFRRLKTPFPYITMMPQEEFLKFITAEAECYGNFRLLMGARVRELVREGSRVTGVRYEQDGTEHELCATLTVGADGRGSRVRKLAGFEPVKTSPPMDVLWFRLPRLESDPRETTGRLGAGRALILINRFDYWQVGFVIPKGTYPRLRREGMGELKRSVAVLCPLLRDRVSELRDWRQVSLLSVESSRCRRWHLPGLLLIGDAAHVMSPVGGVGINYAIADAVAAAEILAPPLLADSLRERHLASVQRRRELPTRIIQALQSFAQRRILAPTLQTATPAAPPLPLRLLARTPFVRDVPARVLAYGVPGLQGLLKGCPRAQGMRNFGYELTADHPRQSDTVHPRRPPGGGAAR